MTTDRTTYTVHVRHEDNSYWATVHELPGCFASAETLEELWEALSEAIGLYLSTPESAVRVKAVGAEKFTERRQFELSTK